MLTAFTEIGVDAIMPWGKSYYQIIRVFLRKQIQNNTIHVFHMKSNTRRVQIENKSIIISLKHKVIHYFLRLRDCKIVF